MLTFSERMKQPRPILLDGATGTELDRRGVDISLPLWSARAVLDAPDVLRQIHTDYVAAGAEVITANTFRTHARSLAATQLSDRASELTRRAVEIAREAAGGCAYVAGSQAPLEDCYSPHLVPDDQTLRSEHAAMAQNLASADVDLILVETQNTIREAVAATRAAVATGVPTLVSFVCGADGRLLSGESLRDAVASVLPFRLQAVLVNCAPATKMTELLHELKHAVGDFPFGAYANTGCWNPGTGWQPTDAENPGRYAEYAQEWLHVGARLVGGCCGTTPTHIASLHALTSTSSGFNW